MSLLASTRRDELARKSSRDAGHRDTTDWPMDNTMVRLYVNGDAKLEMRCDQSNKIIRSYLTYLVQGREIEINSQKKIVFVRDLTLSQRIAELVVT